MKKKIAVESDIKVYRLVTKNGSHEYDVTVKQNDNGKIFELFRSRDGGWTKPGEKLLTIEEDERAGTIKLPRMSRTMELYEAMELGALLRFVQVHGQEKFIDDLTFEAFESGTAVSV